MDRFDALARLRELRAANDRITSNLLELESDPTVAMLDAADLRGVTADRWTDARQTLASLFAAHSTLKQLIETGTTMSARPMLLSGSRLDEVQALLEGPSIVLSDVSLGLADRRLLSDSRRVIRRTADELIAEMSNDFDRVKLVVVLVTEVWDHAIPRLRAERARSLDLTRLADEAGIDVAPLLAPAEALRDISDAVLSDPLTVDVAGLDEISSSFDRVERDIRELQTLVVDWPDHVTDARAMLVNALAAARTCDEAVTLVNSRLVLRVPVEAPVLPQEITDVLDHVIARGSEDRLGRGAGLVAWRRGTIECIADLEATTERCRSLIRERDDLRARLDAYAARAERLNALEHPDVVDAFERARGVLYSAPTDLAVALDLVARCQRLPAMGGDS
jgi:hypothetical protein